MNPQPGPLPKVVFVCIGNACRSQMAEAFARLYGKQVFQSASAGLAPATMIPEVTHKVMREKGIELTHQFPKAVAEVSLLDVDLVVNLSGRSLRGLKVARSRDWAVKDPIGEKESFHRQVRDEIERLVMNLVLEYRHRTTPAKAI